jgi:hypothetical protein
VDGLGRLASTQALHIETTGLSTLNSLSELRVVGGDLQVLTNPQLVDLIGLYGLEAIGGDLFISQNPRLDGQAPWSFIHTIGTSAIFGTVHIDGVTY